MTHTTITTGIEINGYYFCMSDGVYFRGCKRCGGTGHYSFNGYDSICYSCNNFFEARLGDYVGTLEDAQKDADKRAKAKAAREAKKERERLAKLAKREEAQLAVKATHPEVYEYLMDEQRPYDRNSFIASVASKFQFDIGITAAWTENMTNAVLRVIERTAAAKVEAAAHPVPAGRQVVTGEIIGTKVVEGDYGTAYKITVKDDRGFRIYVSLPKAQADEAYDAWVAEIEGDDRSIIDYGYAVWFSGTVVDADGTVKYGVKGRRITFTATLEQSADAQDFGFGSRPTKGAWL